MRGACLGDGDIQPPTETLEGRAGQAGQGRAGQGRAGQGRAGAGGGGVGRGSNVMTEKWSNGSRLAEMGCAQLCRAGLLLLNLIYCMNVLTLHL